MLPLLILILLGCLDLGRAFSVWVALANGTREGARYGSIEPDKATMEAVTEEYILAEGFSSDALTVEATPGGFGQPIRVWAGYRMPLVTLLLFGGQPVTITAQAQMQVLTGGA